MWGRVGVRIGSIATLAVVLSSVAEARSLLPVRSRASQPATPSISEDVSALIAHARHDLSRATLREHAEASFLAPPTNSIAQNPSAVLSALTMPVVGLNPERLYDSWGDPRDGGKRRHRGIDIFAPRGTQVVAVTDAYISFIGNYGKGGRSVWLTTEDGVSFYYAHLDRWVAGIYEGMAVRKGDALGYVGNTGNATSTPPHLHFAVLQNDEAVNPYPVLRNATRSVARPVVVGGFAGGGQ